MPLPAIKKTQYPYQHPSIKNTYNTNRTLFYDRYLFLNLFHSFLNRF